ncbi:hypothetical protein ACU4GD_07130 [Cupriavidus basilensis]
MQRPGGNGSLVARSPYRRAHGQRGAGRDTLVAGAPCRQQGRGAVLLYAFLDGTDSGTGDFHCRPLLRRGGGTRAKYSPRSRAWSAPRARRPVQQILAATHRAGGSGVAAAIATGILFVGATSAFAELKGSLDEIWQAPVPQGRGLAANCCVRVCCRSAWCWCWASCCWCR